MKPQNFGRYRVVGSLGMGAMGCVYEGFDPHIERRVAIKTIRLDELTPEMESEFEARFRSEVRAAGRLHHPNIVALYDAGRDEGVAYTVMEFVEGQDLKRHLDGGARYSTDDAIGLVQQLLSALAAAHAQGVIHRDVKPANVMLTSGRQVKLTDFGVARVLDSGDATRTRGMIVGTVKYASPEQLSGQPLDGRSDLFSVGVLLYRLLTHVHPFEGANELQIMQKVMQHDPPPPSSINPVLPAALDAVVLKALAKKPEQRHASAAEFSGELQTFRAGVVHPESTLARDAGTTTATATQTAWTATRPAASDATVLVGNTPEPARSGHRRWWVGGAVGAAALAAVAAYRYLPRPAPVAPTAALSAASAVAAPAVAASAVAASVVVAPAVAASAVAASVVATASAAASKPPAAPASVRAPATVAAAAPRVGPPSSAAPRKVVAMPSLDGRWSGHYLCSELLHRTRVRGGGPFKADIVIQVAGRTISWTRRGEATLETMTGQITPDGRWSAEGNGYNSVRNDRWLSVATGVFNRKVNPPRFDGELQIMSTDKATLHRKCTLTAVRE